MQNFVFREFYIKMTKILIYITLFIFLLLILFGLREVFKKANQKSWKAFVPFYNFYVLLEIINKPVWLIFLLFVPIINIAFVIIILNFLSKIFGKEVEFTLGLIFLPFIFFPLIGFGDYELKNKNNE